MAVASGPWKRSTVSVSAADMISAAPTAEE